MNLIVAPQPFSDNQGPNKETSENPSPEKQNSRLKSQVKIKEESNESKAFDTSTSPVNTSAMVSKRQSIEGNFADKEPVNDKIAIK